MPKFDGSSMPDSDGFTFVTSNADGTRAVAQALAAHLRAGDLVLLTGALGAGKTTFTQGLATGLRVRGRVSSPTFIVAREHAALGAGPGLVHVDAYRLASLDELDALDLDTSLDDAVTVVEWGEDLAEVLALNRLEIEIQRPTVTSSGIGDDDGIDTRVITFRGIGPRWEQTLDQTHQTIRAMRP